MAGFGDAATHADNSVVQQHTGQDMIMRPESRHLNLLGQPKPTPGYTTSEVKVKHACSSLHENIQLGEPAGTWHGGALSAVEHAC